VFGRNQQPPSVTPEPAVTPESPVEAGKGRPTPKRKEAEAANKRPLVPADRKAAAKDARSKGREQRELEYRAMQTGDERHMPARDRGPVRRYIRDYVDARYNLGEFFLPAAAFFLVLQFALARTAIAFFAILLLYVYILAAVGDAYFLWRGLHKRLVAKFGPEAQTKGLAMYAVLRAFQLRPSRMPKPQVKRRQKPA
jgi:hypothetical protein